MNLINSFDQSKWLYGFRVSCIDGDEPFVRAIFLFAEVKSSGRKQPTEDGFKILNDTLADFIALKLYPESRKFDR